MVWLFLILILGGIPLLLFLDQCLDRVPIPDPNKYARSPFWAKFGCLGQHGWHRIPFWQYVVGRINDRVVHFGESRPED